MTRLRATRCRAHKKTGEQCKKWAILGATVCRVHGGATPRVKKKAAERIAEAADDAAALLVKFMEDPAHDVKVRTQIAQDLLNRAGYSGKNSVDLKVSIFDEAVANGEFLMDLGEASEEEAERFMELEADVPGRLPLELRKRNGRSRA